MYYNGLGLDLTARGRNNRDFGLTWPELGPSLAYC
jgi:hypothetical protein